jgi:hypothetical protein
MHKMSDEAELYRLMPDVEIVRRANSLLLVLPSTGAAVRISPAAEALLPMLEAGSYINDLQNALQQKHPQAKDVASKLKVFLMPLTRSGLLSVGDVTVRRRKGWPKLELFRPDPQARWIANILLKIPQMLRRLLLAMILLGAVAGIAQLIWTQRFPSVGQLYDGLGFVGFFIFFLIVVPCHEAAHAIACRMAGIEVGAAGLILHGGVMLGPYVETTKAYRVKNRMDRFWIPAAGPIINLVATGIAAWWLISLRPDQLEAIDLARQMVFLCAVFVYLDTNPLGPSDGSHMLEAILEDELARRNAWSFKRLRDFDQHTAVRYRVACIVHMVIATACMFLWLF